MCAKSGREKKAKGGGFLKEGRKKEMPNGDRKEGKQAEKGGQLVLQSHRENRRSRERGGPKK